MIGLALEGGGAKGSYQVGAYLALLRNHVKIKAVAGTSIGSLNGAMIAAGDIKNLVDLWYDVSISEILGIDEEKVTDILENGLTLKNIKWTIAEIQKIFKNKGIDPSNYRAAVRNNVDEIKLRKSKIKYGLTTIKLDDLEPLNLTLDDIPLGKLHDYIVASSFLPCFKKEKLVDGSYFLDGGFYNLCPTDMLEEMGCDKIYTINIQGLGRRKKNKNSKAEIIEIKPRANLGNMILFNKNSSRDNMKRGYLDTMKIFKKIDGHEYYFKNKSEYYYKGINRGIDEKLYKAAEIIVNGHDIKDTTIKALEYIIRKEELNELEIYNPKDIMKYVRKNSSDNIIYRYVKSLKRW